MQDLSSNRTYCVFIASTTPPGSPASFRDFVDRGYPHMPVERASASGLAGPACLAAGRRPAGARFSSAGMPPGGAGCRLAGGVARPGLTT
jgi:hypothetical protein